MAKQRRPQQAQVPAGIELVLQKAARDPALRALIVGDRESGLRAAGVSLAPTEAAALRAVPDAVLETMIGSLVGPAGRRSRMRRIVCAAAATVAAGTISCGGARPKMTSPEPKPAVGVEPAPDASDGGSSDGATD